MIFRIKASRFHVISADLYDKSYKSLILGKKYFHFVRYFIQLASIPSSTLLVCTILHTTCLYPNGCHIVLYEKSYNRRATDYCFVHIKKPAGIFTG
jgi:hypothetical protein